MTKQQDKLMAIVHGFIGNNLHESMQYREKLLKIVDQDNFHDGLSISDLGAKLSKVEGKIETLTELNLILGKEEGYIK